MVYKEQGFLRRKVWNIFFTKEQILNVQEVLPISYRELLSKNGQDFSENMYV